jgi:hypothetical protein
VVMRLMANNNNGTKNDVSDLIFSRPSRVDNNYVHIIIININSS